MLKSHENFHSKNGKRQILVADDEIVNREILGEILKADYEVLFACDGEETIQLMRKNQSTLSLVLLDILMPVMSGLDVLKAAKEDKDLSHIPIIVATAERDTEIECLKLGATDFISKPYPSIGVIQARVLRTIELSEDRDIIQSTEKDALTGLYNKEFFYRYAEQYDQFHADTPMDAVILDVNHFHMINERYGKSYGDNILRNIASEVYEMVNVSGGIACRKEADTFMLYTPHRDSYDSLMETASISVADEDGSENRVRLRMGVYANVDKSLEIERRFDRAKMAADTVKGSFAKTIAFYDNNLHECQLYAEQLIEDFPAAIQEKQFKVYYQPKFDIRPDTPVLASAEALVRWIHPTLGMINPCVFIPLFEDNGLIQKLDRYVWEEAAHQIHEWKTRLDYSISVSVNVSRIDMYDPEIADTLLDIVNQYGISQADLMLEITESAYTQDSSQIIKTANNLRNLGFQIEMDDFGTGYSSLNMLSALSIDALKLDMQFIRSAFSEGGNTHMIGVIIGISDYLSVPVIAEGVETAEQLHVLKSLGCDLVQGYFFSKPVPAQDFEAFILQKKEADVAKTIEEESRAKGTSFSTNNAADKIRENLLREQALLTAEDAKETAGDDFFDPDLSNKQSGIQLKTASIFFVIIAFIAAIVLLLFDISVTKGYERMETASDRYIAAQHAASDMESGSDYLTDRVRCFVVTGEIQYLEDFTKEVEQTKRRDKAVESLEILLEGSNSNAIDSLSTALSLSNELVGFENKAMRLMLETGDYDLSTVPREIADIELTAEEKALSTEELKNRAQMLVFDVNYMHYKDRIRQSVSQCTQALIRSSSQDLEQASALLSILVNLQTATTILFLLIVLAIVIIITKMVRKPLTNMVHKMQEQQFIPPTGVEELRFVTRMYNKILQENRDAQEKLSHEASHDALTGLFNRGAYELLMKSVDTEHIAFILIDVDYFKSVNDTYGHAVGDRVLKRVAEILKKSFRSVDILCRIGGDEFAVVMTRVNSSMGQVVLNKINKANDLLQHPKDDLPPVSLSVGVAFSDRKNPQGDIFKDADTALYQVKEAGRKGCKIYKGPDPE